jgi:outer membrane protein OmpA-like peptidoglycan-associated protein
MNRHLLWIASLGIVFVSLCFASTGAFAQQFVVFKVKTPFHMGGVVADSARMNDYYVKIGTEQGIQIGTVLNVYREEEIEAETGNIRFKTVMFIGRMKAYDVKDQYTVGRVTELASHSDPHLDRRAVMVNDFVMPVFVVESENLFDQGSSTLRPEAIRELDRAAAFVRRFRPTKVRIEGHTDNTGDEGLNLDISEARAVSVREYMANQAGFDDNIRFYVVRWP